MLQLCKHYKLSLCIQLSNSRPWAMNVVRNEKETNAGGAMQSIECD